MVVKVVLTFILHLRHWDWWGMFIPLQVTLFCSNHCLYLFSSFSDPLFSFFPPSSINHFPASPSSVDPLFMSFHPMLVLSLTANRCFFASEEVSRGSYTVRWEQMLVLFNTVNTPKAQASLTHTETDWKTHNQTWRMLCRKSLSFFYCVYPTPFLSMSVWIFDWTTIINSKGNCSIASTQITLNWYSWSKKCNIDFFLHLEKHLSDLFGLMKIGVFNIQGSNSPWEYHWKILNQYKTQRESFKKLICLIF